VFTYPGRSHTDPLESDPPSHDQPDTSATVEPRLVDAGVSTHGTTP
jgi:hypothetical protein